MATDADMVAIQNLQNLSKALRGDFQQAGAQMNQNRQQDTAMQFQQQRDAQARAQQQAMLQQQQDFTAERDTQQQGFRAGESVLDRAGALERAKFGRGGAGGGTTNSAQDIVDSMGNRGAKVPIDDKGGFANDPKKTSEPDVQGNIIADSVRSIEERDDDDFQNSKPLIKAEYIEMIKDLKLQGLDTKFARAMVPLDKENKAQYLARVTKYRDNLIETRVQEELAKEDFTKTITGGSLGGATFRTATKEEQAAQERTVRERVAKEVTEKFGGVLGTGK